jgi:hypothetical protein
MCVKFDSVVFDVAKCSACSDPENRLNDAAHLPDESMTANDCQCHARCHEADIL